MFLDRDGVIHRERPDYVEFGDTFAFLPAVDALPQRFSASP
jgi:histidinol phosphatase-like enzyme